MKKKVKLGNIDYEVEMHQCPLCKVTHVIKGSSKKNGKHKKAKRVLPAK